MLRIGLTGGIGAGKSTVARRLVELGATLVDADAIAREVVRPGSPGLAEVAAAFGTEVLDADGALDRPKLGAIVFGDPAARQRLNGILHPLIGRRTAELVAAAPPDAVVVQDIPLLVEGGMGAVFGLVVVVHATVDERIGRLVGDRGMTAADARARIAAQADEPARRAAADVWLDNTGTPEAVRAEVDRLWRDRLVPFEANQRLDRARPPMPPRLVEPDPGWPAQYERLAARIRAAAGERAVTVEHIGSTSVPGLPAKDVLDIQLGVPSLTDGAVDGSVDGTAERDALRAAGFTFCPGIEADNPKPADPDPAHWRKRFYVSADPGRPVNLHVRAVDSAGYRYALLFRDWLRADPAARDEYLVVKRRLERAHRDDLDTSGYAEAKEPWFDAALPLAERWATTTGWRIALSEGVSETSGAD
jgi:dephospho-CoA kinase